ncbi:unnamed protein product [Lampetra fluviatilis]
MTLLFTRREEAARDWEDFEPSCASCSKAFKSLKAKESHDRSKKHRDNVAWLRQQMTAEEFAFLFGAGPQMLPSPTACTAPNQDTAAQTNGTADETAHCDHNARPDGHGAPWLEPTSEDSPGRGRPPGGTRDGGQERRGDGAHEEGGEACEERSLWAAQPAGRISLPGTGCSSTGHTAPHTADPTAPTAPAAPGKKGKHKRK